MERMNSGNMEVDREEKREKDNFYDGKEGNRVMHAAWNLFGLTGGVDEYLLYKQIQRRNMDEFR